MPTLEKSPFDTLIDQIQAAQDYVEAKKKVSNHRQHWSSRTSALKQLEDDAAEKKALLDEIIPDMVAFRADMATLAGRLKAIELLSLIAELSSNSQ